MINSIKNRLLGHAIVKINGVSITIRKLTPMLFLDSDKMYPFSIITDPAEIKNEAQAQDRMNRFKGEIRNIILKAVISPKIDEFIDEFMDSEHHMTLFSAIFLHSMGNLKKKALKQFQLQNQLQLLFIS